MVHSLWFKLSVVFFLLTMFCVTVVGRVPGIITMQHTFDRFVQPENVSRNIRAVQPLFAEAVKHHSSNKWLNLADSELREKLLVFKSPDGGYYIGFASTSELYYRIINRNGTTVASSPGQWTAQATEIFEEQKTASGTIPSDSAYWARKGHIWISQQLLDIDGQSQGRMEVLFVAKYDVWSAVKRTIRTYHDIWYYMFIFFAVIGVACGFAANYFVTGRLKTMHAVTSIWCQGNLTPRISINEKSHDILAQHSRMLNIMADEMQSLLELRYRAAVSEERHRVARELHDTVKQNLFALRLQLATINQKNQNNEIALRIDEACKIIDESQHDIANILAQLNSSLSESRGFYERLAALSENMLKRYQMKTAWKRKEVVAMSSGEEQTLIRIAQETMNNAARHGHATEMVMDVFRQGGFIYWTLSDNGQGFDKSQAAESSGLGLIFLRERAGDLPEGEFSITSHKGGGTVVKIKWRAI